MHVTLRCNVISSLCNGAAFAMRKRNEIPFVYAQMKRATTLRRRNGPIGPNRLGAIQVDAADWLVRRRLLVAASCL